MSLVERVRAAYRRIEQVDRPEIWIDLRPEADVLGEAQSPADLGRHFGATLYAREVDYLMDWEWARTADDVLWRRSKLGLRFNAHERAELAGYMAERLAGMGKRQ